MGNAPKMSRQVDSYGLDELVQTQDMKESTSPIIKKLAHVKTSGMATLNPLKPALAQI
jgi:hypothetical protein